MAESPQRRSALAQLGESYWVESRRPLASLIFTAPLLILYEAGILLLPKPIRNGAELWMRQWLDQLGFSQYFLLPLGIVCLLLAWHYVSRQPWRVPAAVLYGMAGECALLALGLRLLVYLYAIVFHAMVAPPRMGILDSLATITAYLGAGIYEELLFRLMLLGATIRLLRWLRVGPRASTLGAILATSLLFSAAHYVPPFGSPLQWTFEFWFTFLFRLLAGVFFAVLFLYRGFGVAAGTHAGYDVLIALTSPG
jgi:membrane protease YdiL (CAAX protease family)